MQDLIIYNDNQVILQADGKIYQDTKANFTLDYGELPKIKVERQSTLHPFERIALLDETITNIDYNRETKGCWLNGEAFQEYPNELCEDILNSIDILLANKKKREYVISTLDELKAQKLAAIDQWTAAKITGDFTSSASGEPVKYDSDKDTQLTMQGIALNVHTAQFAEKYPDGCPVRGYAEGASEKSVYMLTAEQVMRWQADLSIHIGDCKVAGWQKQAEVQAAQSKEELEAIILN